MSVRGDRCRIERLERRCLLTTLPLLLSATTFESPGSAPILPAELGTARGAGGSHTSTAGTIGLTVSKVSIAEDIGEIVATVSRSGGTAGTVSVSYSTVAITAGATDFTAESGTVEFLDGVTQQQIRIAILDDAEVESDEQFRIVLSDVTGGADLGPHNQLVTIQDNDQPSPIVYVEDFEGLETWTQDADGNDTATSGRWEIGAPDITEHDGSVVQPSTTAGGARAIITGLSRLESATSNDVDGVTTATSREIELPVGQTLTLTFDAFVAHAADSSDEDYLGLAVIGETEETVYRFHGAAEPRLPNWTRTSIDLTPFAGQTVQLQMTAADLGDDSLFEAGVDNVQITASPEPTIELAFSSSEYSVTEGNRLTLDVFRTGPAGEVTVDFTTVAGTADASDFLTNSGTLTFGSEQSAVQIEIRTLNDASQEQLETFTVELSNPTGGGVLVEPSLATVTIADNDSDSPDFLPDLVPLTDDMVANSYMDVSQMPGRALLRFPTTIANAGDGPLEIWGGSDSGATQRVFQRVYQDGGDSRDRLAGNFVFHPSHGHVHLEGFAIFSLRSSNEDGTPGPIVASGGKTSFCLLDISHPFPEATADASLASGRGGSDCENVQGINVGYADVYGADLPDQWIDITELPDGEYFLEIETDPDNNLLETDDTNNVAVEPVTVDNPYFVDGEFVDAPVTPDDDHPDVAQDSPVTIPFDEAINASLEYGGDIDVFQFEAVEGRAYNFFTTLNGLGDSVIRILDVDGITQLDRNDDAGGSLASSLTWTAPTDGTYYAEVRGFDTSDTGAYSATVVEIADDFGNTAGTAASFEFGTNIPGFVDYQGDRDWFAFTASDRQFYEIRVRGSSELRDTFVSLYDADGFTLLSQNDNLAAGETSRITWQADATETLYAVVSAGPTDTDGTGEYRFRVNEIEPPEDDFANLASDATLLTTIEDIAGEVSYTRDIDLFKISGIPDASYLVQLDSEFGEPSGKLRILDANGEVLSESFAANESQQLVVTQAETPLFVEVSSVDGQQGSYTLGLVVEDGQSVEAATAKSIPSQSYASLHAALDRDWFSVDLNASSTYAFAATPETSNPALDLEINVYNFDGSTVVASNDDELPTVINPRLLWSPEVNGRYFVEVRSPNAQTGDYRLTLDDLTPTDDFTNLVSEAERRDPYVPVRGNIEYAADVDWHRWVLRRNETYGIQLSTETLEPVTVHMFDTDRQTLLDEVTAMPAADGGISYTPTSSGSRYFEVSGAKGSYTLTVGADDHGNAASVATTLAVDTPITGDIEHDGDADWFKFEASIYFQYRIETTLTSGDSTLQLIDGEGQQIAYNDDHGDGLASRISWTPATSGYYFAVVESFSGTLENYTVTIHQEERTTPPVSTGDFNRDGNIDAVDIDLLFAALRDGGDATVYDLTDDDELDSEDVGAFFGQTGVLRADGDLNGQVEFSDFLAVAGSFGESNVGWSRGEYTGDGIVDFADFLAVAEHFGAFRQ